jgi:thiosulfate/3-mercaptopyruvate sulfurtransferase
MFSPRQRRSLGFLFLSSLTVLFAAALTFLPSKSIRGDEKKAADPWASSQVLQPADLARQLTDKSSTLPTVIYVGFRTLYAGGHITGASFHGTPSTEQGLAELKKWADTLPRSNEIVIYCGCCPFEKCPNIRPAFVALNGMGFKNLRVLVLPTSFATDWADKGYPMQKGM